MAALLLAKDEGTIVLLHTPGTDGTGKVASNLRKVIKRKMPQVKVIPREVDDADSERIAARMSEIFNDFPLESTACIGLNYTGGTKAMSVHAYLAVKNKFPSPVFSYLDARTLSLIIDERESESVKKISVGESCNVEIEELLLLHGYSPPQIRREPVLPAFCHALAQVYSQDDSLSEWQNWLKTEHDKKAERFERLPEKSRYPLLGGVLDEIYSLCDGKPSTGMLAKKLGKDKLSSCQQFLEGIWLEEYTLSAIKQIADEFGIGKNLGINIKFTTPRRFELDVAFVRGYQLFALSCKAKKDKKELKLALSLLKKI